MIERAVATIGKDASSGEGMTFYTVTLEYFKFLLPDEHFMLARTFLQQVYQPEATPWSKFAVGYAFTTPCPARVGMLTKSAEAKRR